MRFDLISIFPDYFAPLNLSLMGKAAQAGLVRVGGMLTYSTCTAFKEENEQVVDRFLKMKTGESFVVESTMAVKLVEGGPDAHYAVRLRRVR